MQSTVIKDNQDTLIRSNPANRRGWVRNALQLWRAYILATSFLFVLMCKDPLATGKPRPYCEGECENGRGVKYARGYLENETVDFDGIFQNGYLTGQGTITWGNGVVYRGNVQWNVRSGKGIRTAPGQPNLEGYWVSNYAVCVTGDCTNSFGELIFIDSDAEWRFLSPAFNTDAPYFSQWNNWDRYIGHFQAGKLYGCGAVVREGKVDWGLWNDNRLVKNRADECREELKEVIANDTGERFIRCYPSEGCIDEK